MLFRSNTGKTKYMEIGCHRSMTTNAHIKISSNSKEKVKTFINLGSLLTNQNSIQEEIICRLKAGNSWPLTLGQERRLRFFENRI